MVSERHFTEELIVQKIPVLEQRLSGSMNVRSQLKAAQNDLLSYYDYKRKGTIIRSWARWIEEPEQ